MGKIEIVRITGCTNELKGVGRLQDGRAVFIPGALPGELVETGIVLDRGRFCEGEVLRILEASPRRQIPPCPHAGRCGGCAALHMDYDLSLELKRRTVADAFERIGKLAGVDVRPVIGVAQPQAYRNKAEYAVSREGGRIYAGLREKGSQRVLEIGSCLLQHPRSLEALRVFNSLLKLSHAALRYFVTRVNRQGELMLVLSGTAPTGHAFEALAKALAARLDNVTSVWYCALKPKPTHALDGRCTRLAGSDTFEDELLKLRFELSPQSFFQVNPVQTEVLYRIAVDAAVAAPGLTLLDAYCGAGTISLTAAARGAKVLGVEIVSPAIENAKRNARLNGLHAQSEFICGDAAKLIPALISRGRHFDAAIVDPPRKGVDAALITALASAHIPRIVYVSCDPATLARDAGLLCRRGYTVEWAQPVDMFPLTHHIECVTLLVKQNSGHLM